MAAAEAAISHTPPAELGEAATPELTSTVPEASIPAAADDDPEREAIRLSGPKPRR